MPSLRRSGCVCAVATILPRAIVSSVGVRPRPSAIVSAAIPRPLNSTDARRVVVLTAEVGQLRALAVADELDRVLGHFMGEELADARRDQESEAGESNPQSH